MAARSCLGVALILPLLLQPVLPGLLDGLLAIIVWVGLLPLYIMGFFSRNDLGEHYLLLGVWAILSLLFLRWSSRQESSRTRLFLLGACTIAILVSWVGQVRVLDAKSLLFASTGMPAAVTFALTGLVVAIIFILRMLFEDLELLSDY